MSGVWSKSRSNAGNNSAGISRWQQSTEQKLARRDWRKRMSDNVAYALLVYTGLQIFVTMRALKGEGGSIMPYLALILLVGAIIPACRRFEKRWMSMPDDAAQDPAMKGPFRRDQLMLWLMAIGLPFLLTGLFRFLATVI